MAPRSFGTTTTWGRVDRTPYEPVCIIQATGSWGISSMVKSLSWQFRQHPKSFAPDTSDDLDRQIFSAKATRSHPGP